MSSLTSAALRREIGARNLERASRFQHEMTYGEVTSVLYQDADGLHGNFYPPAYRAILAREEWCRRLQKSYTASARVPRSNDRRRFELDCANSSDALLMNIFCCPRVTARPQLASLLGVERNLMPEFGVRAGMPLINNHVDRTEIDMRLGDLLVEAKLTESGFQSVPPRLLRRYAALEEVFDIDELSQDARGQIRSYQLIRGVLAAHATGCSFAVLCDARRTDLIEQWFRVMSAARNLTLRSTLRLITWQEIANTLPRGLRSFLSEKYGIAAAF